ncbi:Fungal specific transcription factor domain-containing protein [Cladophialophora immunda]|nr:Fungal specific transcription factor domain-containing protein [Cladophialophora immunda]
MPRAEQRIRGGGNACQRCRRRKQKVPTCDQRYPQCSNCESVNAACLTYHFGKQVEIPRDYVSNLEEQIAALTQEVQDLRERTRGHSAADEDVANTVTASHSVPETGSLPPERQSGSDESSPLFQDLVTKVKNVVVEPFQQPRFLGQSSGISFAKMVLAAIHVDNLSSPLVPEQQPFHEFSLIESSPAKASLPPRHVADHLVDVYFQYRTPHLPILDRLQVSKAIDSAYRSLGTSQGSIEVPERDMFIAYMVFAIALVDVPHTSGGRPSQSDGCFRSALGWVEKILTYSKSDVETLRTVLLLAQFVALSPSRGSLWHLTGFALRLCIDVGLHWETESQCLNTDPDVLDDRRRLWHSTYHFDRLLCITLGRPFGILDESTRVQLPNPWTGCRPGRQQPSEFDIHTQRAHNHLFALARLESEIRHVQHSQVWALKPAYPRPSWTVWLQDVLPRLQEWNATVPEPGKAHPSSIFASQAYWEVIYQNTILQLYRPHVGNMYRSTEELFITFEASSKVIVGLKVLQREGRVEMLWKSVHHLFLAGLGVIYGLWHSKEIRDQNPVGKSISTLQSCASTLSAMSETFHGAAGCRNAFDTLSSVTIDWLVTRDIEEIHQNRLEFENHVRELTKQLQLSRDGTTANVDHRADNMLAVLSTDNFDLSELLNSAAQWPDLGEFNFIMGEQVSMMDTALVPAAGDTVE